MNLLNNLRLLSPEEIPNKNIKCELCGKFLSIGDNAICKGKVKLDFTPDTEYTSESFDYYHKDCWEKLKKLNIK